MMMRRRLACGITLVGMTRSMRCIRRGFTLLELLAALAIGGVLLTLGIRSLVTMRDALAVRTASRTLAGAFSIARATALAQHETVLLLVTPEVALVRHAGAADDSWRAVLDDNVQLEGAPRIHRYAPDGLMLDVGAATYTLRRGASMRRVIVAKYGRVRIE